MESKCSSSSWHQLRGSAVQVSSTNLFQNLGGMSCSGGQGSSFNKSVTPPDTREFLHVGISESPGPVQRDRERQIQTKAEVSKAPEPNESYTHLRSTTGCTPLLYGLSKIHKPDIPLRPITSFVQSHPTNFQDILPTSCPHLLVTQTPMSLSHVWGTRKQRKRCGLICHSN